MGELKLLVSTAAFILKTKFPNLEIKNKFTYKEITYKGNYIESSIFSNYTY